MRTIVFIVTVLWSSLAWCAKPPQYCSYFDYLVFYDYKKAENSLFYVPFGINGKIHNLVSIPIEISHSVEKIECVKDGVTVQVRDYEYDYLKRRVKRDFKVVIKIDVSDILNPRIVKTERYRGFTPQIDYDEIRRFRYPKKARLLSSDDSNHYYLEFIDELMEGEKGTYRIGNFIVRKSVDGMDLERKLLFGKLRNRDQYKLPCQKKPHSVDPKYLVDFKLRKIGIINSTDDIENIKEKVGKENVHKKTMYPEGHATPYYEIYIDGHMLKKMENTIEYSDPIFKTKNGLNVNSSILDYRCEYGKWNVYAEDYNIRWHFTKPHLFFGFYMRPENGGYPLVFNGNRAVREIWFR